MSDYPVSVGVSCKNCGCSLDLPRPWFKLLPEGAISIADALLWIGNLTRDAKLSDRVEIQMLHCESCGRIYAYTTSDVFIQLPESATSLNLEEV